jgi:purine-binding chemotaxis protein CheW
MSPMMLVVVIAGRRAGIPALAVNSVIDLAAITPVPRTAPHVLGLSALRSRPLTVIDCRAALGIEPSDGDEASRRAVVIEHDGHLYGLLVDAADDIVASLAEPSPVGADPGPGWREAASGRVETEAGALLLLDINALIAGTDHGMAHGMAHGAAA